MPTRNRRRFVSQAIWYFLRQDYPRKELIVIDDGDDAVADLIPADERIRYVRLDRRMALGAKRNIGCETSRGDFIAHWDDDDWIAPHRLSMQMQLLQQSDADICGARELLHYGLQTAEAWLYRPLEGDPRWLAGGTLLYRRDAWKRVPFPPIDIGEDVEFLHRHPPETLLAAPDASFYVALIHPENTSAKLFRDPRWERRPFEEVAARLAPDCEFYAALRHGRVIDTAPRRGAAEAITVIAPFMIYDGYGSLAEFLVLGMKRAGALINVVPLCFDEAGLSPELVEIVRTSSANAGELALYFSWPNGEPLHDRFVYTMWESSRLPASWTPQLNGARAVFVPTRFVAGVCRDSGVTVPLEVIPLGIDPAIYRYIERPARDDFTTLIVGSVIGRKHVREAIAGWKLAFAGDAAARLIIKSRFQYGNYRPDDPRISFVDDNESTRGIAHWYERADVLVAVGNEGFGLPLIEGMATGLPVIALSSEGQGDTCTDAGSGRLLAIAPERWEVCKDGPWGVCGERGVPGANDIAERLRWVATHRDQARAMGRAASEWARAERDVWKTGPMVVEAMEKHITPSRPLRRLPTLWVPSWQRECGISEYTAYLAGPLPNVRIAAEAPDLRGVGVLHVQHEHSLFNDTTLTTSLQRARAGRVPVVITEHTVQEGMVLPWEREAHVLTALTEGGAELLRRRWPQKRVEYVAHGCPTWFPPRKKTRGRVIGAFGFLERYKGFWRLLDMLRAMPDCELLLVAHPKYPQNQAEWDREAAGLPIRHHNEYLPVDEAARLLAAEADVLVYWYDDIAHFSASGAVRVGLASGVPVLASPTSWFRDLRAATYQPHDLGEGIRRLLDDTALRDETASAARDYCHEHSWPKTAERHRALWQSLEAMN